jgi:hypothetical protein
MNRDCPTKTEAKAIDSMSCRGALGTYAPIYIGMETERDRASGSPKNEQLRGRHMERIVVSSAPASSGGNRIELKKYGGEAIKRRAYGLIAL